MAANTGWPSLSQEQQRLLLSALTSGKGNQAYESRPSFGGGDVKPSDLQDVESTGLPPGVFEKTDDIFGTFDTSVDQFTYDDKVQSSPEEVNLFDSEFGEKRKSPDDDADDDDDDNIDSKRRDSNDDKISKKPGRKPITTEPTTKRKAQNRAAQRAFRERKEKHLKDLETKVKELEEASTTANEENSLLRAQVSKLQGELKDYKKRMSFTNSSSPPRTSDAGNNMFSSGVSDFNFDFTKFGSPQYNSPSNTNDSASRGASPNDNSNGYSPATTNGSTSQNNNSLYGFFDVNTNPYGFNEGKIATNSPTHFYSNKHQPSVDAGASSASSAASPSSDSQKATSCSSCTSPGMDDFAIAKTGETPDITKQSSLTWPSIASQAKDTSSDLASFDWLASQNGGIFDPVLFGGYRESQDAVIGDGDFTSGFFEDPLNFDEDIAGPFGTGALPNASKNAQPNLLEQVEKQQEAAQYDNVESKTPQGNDSKHLYTAQAVWNQLQHCPKFQSGDFDLDGLCADLKKKAKCSESGMAIPEKAVKDALWRLAGADPEPKTA